MRCFCACFYLLDGYLPLMLHCNKLKLSWLQLVAASPYIVAVLMKRKQKIVHPLSRSFCFCAAADVAISPCFCCSSCCCSWWHFMQVVCCCRCLDKSLQLGNHFKTENSTQLSCTLKCSLFIANSRRKQLKLMLIMLASLATLSISSGGKQIGTFKSFTRIRNEKNYHFHVLVCVWSTYVFLFNN